MRLLRLSVFLLEIVEKLVDRQRSIAIKPTCRSNQPLTDTFINYKSMRKSVFFVLLAIVGLAYFAPSVMAAGKPRPVLILPPVPVDPNPEPIGSPQ